MLQKTLKNMDTLKQGKGTPGERQKMANELKQMARRLGSGRMDSLSEQAQSILGKSNGDPNADTAMSKVLANAASVIERELLKAALRKKVRLSRAKGQQAPGEYRRLVEEYFKALSEDEDE